MSARDQHGYGGLDALRRIGAHRGGRDNVKLAVNQHQRDVLFCQSRQFLFRANVRHGDDAVDALMLHDFNGLNETLGVIIGDA